MDFSFMATSFLSSSFVQAKVINNATFYYHWREALKKASTLILKIHTKNKKLLKLLKH
jgi:hypothetical protein